MFDLQFLLGSLRYEYFTRAHNLQEHEPQLLALEESSRSELGRILI